jgi:hypothetical protein
MDFKKVLSETGRSLLAHWLTALCLAAWTVAVPYLGVIIANWSWPAALACGTVMLAAGLVIYTNFALRKPASKLAAAWSSPTALIPKTILRQHYENETVHLDGKMFVDCKFLNVAFVWEGTAPCGFHNCTIGDPLSTTPIVLRSGHPIVQQTMLLMQLFKLMRPGTGTTFIDDKNR